MVICSTFESNLDCVLQLQNEFNIKLIILIFMFGYILFSLWYSKEMDFDGDYLSMFKYISFKVFPLILLVFFPFFLLLLKNSVSLELMITTLTVFYFLVLALFIGLGLFSGKAFIRKILGDRRDLGSKFKYIRHKD